MMKWPLSKPQTAWMILFVVVWVLIRAYNNYIGATRVALVNYQSFQAAKFVAAKQVGWVNVEQIDNISYDELIDYDLVLVFGRGLRLKEQELDALKRAATKTRVVVDSAMNPAHDINSIAVPHKDIVAQYLQNAGNKNYHNLLRYLRSSMQTKYFASVAAEPPLAIASNVLFHVDPNAIFNTVSGYETYYQQLDHYQQSGKKIALMTSVPGPFNANRDHVDALIQRLEQETFRVYPMASSSQRLELLKTIQPDAVIMMPHGRLHLGDAQLALDWLQQQNIPVLSPLSVFDDYERWLSDPQGYSGALLSMNVALPELDGAIAPYVINAQFKNAQGFSIFNIIPERLDTFVSLLKGFLLLKATANQYKKVGIVYFRGPGKNALVAGNMEVAHSLFNTLHRLKKQGYDLNGLPEQFITFKQQLDKQGLVMTPEAMGQSQAFLTSSNPAFIAANQYRQWCQSLASTLCEQVEALYGKAPGNFLVDDKRGIAVARLQYGNIVIMPQPLPGYGDDTFKLVHGTDKAPPHTYLAAYFWLQHQFQADAVIHFGTHGSLEFTPNKQVALSQRDWADALLGGLPHFYLYTVSNVGEAIIAKRRSYATIINHLTPPFAKSGLSPELTVLTDQANKYTLAQGAVKEQLRKDIIQTVIRLGIDNDLELSTQQLNEAERWQAQVLTPLSQWLETIASEKITEGLYTLGEAYNQQQVSNTLTLMFVDPLAYQQQQMIQLANTLGLEPQSVGDANRWIMQRLQGTSVADIMYSAFGNDTLQAIDRWRVAHPKTDDMDIIRGFVALGDSRNTIQTATELSAAKLKEVVARVMADPEAKTFVMGLSGDKQFSHVSKVLSPAAAEKAKVLAKVIPAIGKALQQLEKPDVMALVQAMQTPAVRQQVIRWMQSNRFVKQVEKAKQWRNQQLLSKALEQISSLRLDMDSTSFKKLSWQQQNAMLTLHSDFAKYFLHNDGISEELGNSLLSRLGYSVNDFEIFLQQAIQRYSTAYQQTLLQYEELATVYQSVQQLLHSIPNTVRYLQDAAGFENRALLNALNGGYVMPSAGGDPILNPLALPTGKNMFSIDAEKTPSLAAWRVGVELAQTLINQHQHQHGEWPKKVAFTLWPSSFIHSQGATIAEILYLLGVEPVRDPFGRIQSLRLIPSEQLGRPRIDVVVQSAGQLRDLAASRLALIEEAVLMAANADDNADNFVNTGIAQAEKYLLEQGLSPLSAKQLAARRSFGGVNNAYGTGIMSLVESSDQWDSQQTIAKQYIKNMGAVYGDSDRWGEFQQHVFTAALLNTEVIVQPRSSNTWGALSLDHVYEFMGGLSAAVTEVTGKTPDAFFNDFRNSSRAAVTSLAATIGLETRSTLLNPTYIKALTKGGASSAETFAETFRNTFSWNAMRPEAISDELWHQLHDVYINDNYQLKLQAFFEKQNPYALQEMTGVMLDASRKGFWQASDQQLTQLANLHAQLVANYEAGCGSFTCGNAALAKYIESLLDGVILKNYQQALNQAEGRDTITGSVVLVEKQNTVNNQTTTRTEKQTISNEPQTDTAVDKQQEQQATASGSTMRYNIWILLALLISIAVIVFWRTYRVKH